MSITEYTHTYTSQYTDLYIHLLYDVSMREQIQESLLWRVSTKSLGFKVLN